MTSIDLETLLTIVFVEVDDWYEANHPSGRAGCPAIFKDSEVMTLMIAQEYIPYPAETQYLGYIRANHGRLFPQLVDQSQFNRRARGLRHVVERMRRDWVVGLGVEQDQTYLLDTKPLPVVGYKRSKKHSNFRGSAAYGYCASRNLHYFGYKLVMTTTLDGVPVIYDLVPANSDERQAAETVLDRIAHADILGDKGFLGIEWQTRIHQQTGNTLITPKRKNQSLQHSPAFDRLLNSLRERIEGVFHELHHTGRNLEHLLAKTVVGLVTRLVAKLTAHLFRRILRLRYGVDVQSFRWSSLDAF